jgi:osmotically-inducible protein OsmY
MKAPHEAVSLGVAILGLAWLSHSALSAQTQSPSVRTTDAATESRAAEPRAGDPDPAVAAEAVKRALAELREPSAAKVNVATHASIVVLTGSASSDAEASRIVSAAERAAGGVRVMSQLDVKPSTDAAQPAASMQLVSDVEAALRRDPRTKDLEVTVSLDAQQTIVLQGLVPSRENRAAAQAVAQQTRGVNRIENRLLTASQ